MKIARTIEESRSLPKYKWYPVRCDFFANPNPVCSYWAGFLAADGWIVNKTNAIGLRLAAIDRPHIALFCSRIGYTGPILSCPCRLRATESAQVQIYGVPHLISDLNRHYSVTPRKTLTLKPPVDLDLSNSVAFIAGLFDGDGTCRCAENQNPILSWSGTLPVMEWVKKISDDLFHPKSSGMKVHKVKGKNCHVWTMTGERAFGMCKLMMHFAGSEMLHRKVPVLLATSREAIAS